MIPVRYRKPGLVVLGFVIVVGAGGGWYWQHHKKTTTQTPTQVTMSSQTPDEQPVSAGHYPGLPKSNESEHLTIPSISLDALVQRVGTDQYLQIAVPTNVMLAGWYTQSAIPGEKGLSIIDGHVNGKTRAGVFAKLAQVKVGDKIGIQLANGSKRSFTVMQVLTVPTKDATNQLFSQDPKVVSQLNLVTCNGVYDPAANDFTERTIVTASLE